MKYISPECEILEFTKDDIITTSTPNDTPMNPTGTGIDDLDLGWF